MIQVGVILFAGCLLTQVRASFYHCLRWLFNKCKVYIDEIVGYYTYQNGTCVKSDLNDVSNTNS